MHHAFLVNIHCQAPAGSQKIARIGPKQLCPCLSSRQSIEPDPGKLTGQQSQCILTLAKAAVADEVTNDATSAATAQRLCWSLVDISRTICHQCQIMLQFQFQQSSDHHAKSSGSVSCLETTAYKAVGSSSPVCETWNSRSSS